MTGGRARLTRKRLRDEDDKENEKQPIDKITVSSTLKEINQYIYDYMSSKCYENLVNLLADNWKNFGTYIFLR